MNGTLPGRRPRLARRRTAIALLAAAVAGGTVVAGTGTAGAAAAGSGSKELEAGNLLLSRTVYTGQVGLVQPGVTVLPPGCLAACAVATADGSYPGVFANEAVDASFGVTSPIFLDQVTPSGRTVSTVTVPVGQVVTSFPSKSELALNLSVTGRSVSFMGYAAPTNALDISNTNTPAVIDPTNPVPGAAYRVVATLNEDGKFSYTLTNAYSGNNGRAAVLNDSKGADVLYLAGNAGNGGNPQPFGVITGAGAQIVSPSTRPEAAQTPGAPTPLGSFNITQLGVPADKIGKDTNFRGLTVHDNVVYYTKGSGGNGVNTVYFVDTTGTACPSGVGVPAPGAKLPTSALAYDPALVAAKGLTPTNMCILAGFPTALKSKTSFPFGIWFADANTAYVADEGNGTTTYDPATNTYTAAAAQTTAGLQKWVRTAGTWSLAYTLTHGLALGTPYTVAGYPTGTNPTTGLPWAPATDGLRNITGRVNKNGTVTIWAITSTVSGNTDQGADPNRLVTITDNPTQTTPPATETFQTVRTAAAGEALRGISFTPGTDIAAH